MRNYTLALLCCLLFSSSYAQSGLSRADWQADLRFLQKTVHQDYSFLFKKTTAEKFDAAVEALFTEIPSLEEYEILAGFSRIVCSFQYGHTDISWRGSPVRYHMLPLNLYHFSDGIYIEGAHQDYETMLGTRILKIEGMPVEKALEAIRPLVPVENEQYFKAYGLSMLLIPEALHAQKVTKTLKKNISMTLERDGNSFEQSFAAVDAYLVPRQYGLTQEKDDWRSARDQSSTPYYLKNLDKIYYYEYLAGEKTLYVRHSQIQDEPGDPIPAFYERVFDFIEKNDVERLVLDVRLNGGGNNYKNKPIVTGIIRSEKINQPGKLFVIIGRRTFSACQNLVNELSNYTNATFVGEPTSENINFYGDNRRIALPKSNTPVFLSFAWWQDKPQWENADWLAPNLAVEMSFEDYHDNRDPVLDAIINSEASGLVLDPLSYLKDLFMANKLDEVKSEATRLVNDSKYRFVNFEEQFNKSGYDLFNQKNLEGAIFVFQLNVELFPQSANAWDSLGEGYWKAKQIPKSIECYNKAIELDPKGETGDNARAMLKQIKGEK